MFFNLFKRKEVILVGSFVLSSDNFYGEFIPCEVVRIYDRVFASAKVRYCKLSFVLDGKIKTINVTYKSCQFVK
jgi:hypothetical protein